MSKRNDVSVKIDASVYRMAKTVASWKGESLAEYLSRIIEPVARRDMAKIHTGSRETKVENGDEAD